LRGCLRYFTIVDTPFVIAAMDALSSHLEIVRGLHPSRSIRSRARPQARPEPVQYPRPQPGAGHPCRPSGAGVAGRVRGKV